MARVLTNTKVVRNAVKEVLGYNAVDYVDSREHGMVAMKMWGWLTDEQVAQVIGYCKEHGVQAKVKRGTARWYHSYYGHCDVRYEDGMGTRWTRVYVKRGEVGA